MAISPHPKNARDGTLTITSGSGTVYTLQYTDGDFSVSGLTEGQKGVEAIQDRGSHHALVYTNQTYPEFSFSGTLTEISDSTERTPSDIVMKLGAFSSEASTLGADAARPWTCDVLWQIEGTDHGDGSDHSLKLDDCRMSIDFSEGLPIDTFSVSGVCYGTITAT